VGAAYNCTVRSSISASTKALIDSLFEPVPRVFGRSERIQQIVASIVAIAQAGETAATLDMVPLLLHDVEAVRRAMADAVAVLLKTLRADEYVSLDQEMRVRSRPYSPAYRAWTNIGREQVGRLQDLPVNAAALGMATLHWSGYVRQAAVKRLIALTTGAELPFLLLRLNDWVFQVREAAAQAIRYRMHAAYAAEFVAFVPLVVRLRETQRSRGLDILDELDGFMNSRVVQEALVAGMDSPDIQVRRHSTKLAKDPEVIPKIRDKALADHDPVVRVRGARMLATIGDADQAREALSHALHDRVAAVRRSALEMLVQRFPAAALPTLEVALLDRNRSIRGLAQFHWERDHGGNAAAFYRGAISRSDTSSQYGAISGIGDVGEQSDSKLVMPYVSHHNANLRGAAFRALGRLDPNSHVAILLSGLEDQNAHVSREAARTLSKIPHLINGATLWNVFTHASTTHVRRNALGVISRLSKWESVAYLIEALCDGSDGLAQRSRVYLQQWERKFNRTFTSPTTVQKERIAHSVQRARDVISKETRMLLGEALG
jgi:HEAT repeat protein